MEVLYVLLTIALVIDSILLVILILMQKTKGAEIGAVFGSGAAAAVLGAGATNFLTKLTYWLGGIFLALVLSLSIINHNITKEKYSTQIPVEQQTKQDNKDTSKEAGEAK